MNPLPWFFLLIFFPKNSLHSTVPLSQAIKVAAVFPASGFDRYDLLISLFLLVYLETASYYLSLAGLDLAMWTKLSLNSQIPS